MLLSSIGVILGAITFAIADYRVLLPAICSVVVSSLAWTTYAKYKDAILAGLSIFLIMFFNYNLRAEYLEYFDYDKYLNSNNNYYLKVVKNPKQTAFFKDEIIIEVKENDANFLIKLREWALPYRLSARVDSSQGLEKNDILEINKKADQNISVEKINRYSENYYKKDKIFFRFNSKTKFSFIDHHESWIDSLQKSIKNYYQSTMSYENAQITSSLILGTRVVQPPEDFIKQARALGLGHFFAASGFHLLILSLVLMWLFNLFRLKELTSINLSLVAVFIYSAVAGFSPSIIRAAIFISAYLLMKLLNRKLDSIKFLILLAGLVLFIDPYTIFDLGFQFSYISTLGILIWTRPIKNKLDLYRPASTNPILIKIFDALADVLSCSIAAQIFLVPLIIYYFSNLQIWTLVANLLLASFLSFIVVLSFLGLSFIIEPLINLLKFILNLSSNLPFIDLQTEISPSSLTLLILLFNLLAYIWLYGSSLEKNAETKDSVMSAFSFKLINNKYTQWAFCIALTAFLTAGNLGPLGLHHITIKSGELSFDKQSRKELISQKAISFFEKKAEAKTASYQYFKFGSLKALAMDGISSLSELNELKDDLREVHVLIIPKLSSKDIYYDTILKITKPQLVISSSLKESKRAKENIEMMAKSTNTIINSGIFYFNDNAYWSIRKAP